MHPLPSPHTPFDAAETEPPPLSGYADVLDGSFRKSYADASDTWTREEAMAAVAPLLLALLRPRSLVLDVGAGRGRDTLALLEAGHRVDAVDLVAAPEWSGLERHHPDRCRFLTGDLLTVPLALGYDAMLDNGCLHLQHPSRYASYLERLHAHAAPGSLFVVNLFTPSAARPAGTLWSKVDGRLTRDFTEPEARALLEAHGWRVRQVHWLRRTTGNHHYLVLIATRPEL